MKDEACFPTLHSCLNASMPGDEISPLRFAAVCQRPGGNASYRGEEISPALSPGDCSREGGVTRSPKRNSAVWDHTSDLP